MRRINNDYDNEHREALEQMKSDLLWIGAIFAFVFVGGLIWTNWDWFVAGV